MYVVEKQVDRGDLIVRNAQFLALLEQHHGDLMPAKKEPPERRPPTTPGCVTDPELLALFYRRVKFELQMADKEDLPEIVAPVRRPSIAMIVAEVAAFYKMTVDDILSQRRPANVSKARQIAAYLCKVHTLHSSTGIGRQLGDRDHTTILHAVKKVEAKIKTDEALRDEIEILNLKISDRLNQTQEVKAA